MRTAIVLFTRDLRVHDQPALAAAVAAAEQVVPLFVFDPAVLERFGVPNRAAFLLDALRDLGASLRERGGALAVREGEVVSETMRLAEHAGAEAIFVSEDVSGYAQARERRLRRACVERRIELVVLPGATIVPPGDLAPSGADHYRVFTPYWRKWRLTPRRQVVRPPKRIRVPGDLRRGRVPALGKLASGVRSPELPRGGETEGRRRLGRWLVRGLQDYGRLHDDLAADATSRLGAFLHFGCLSPLEVVERASSKKDGEPFLRQLAWRDFFHQLLAARPETSRVDMRSRGDCWRADDKGLAAWMEGRTGFPIVDAGMRQLLREGFIHSRARLITASFLSKDLYVDWRAGARHYFDWLVDGDVANNVGNWQWVAGTGADTRPNRMFNPIRQARRFDPDGDYVRRYVPELRAIDGAAVHEPWKLDADVRARLDYPEPIVDHGETAARFRRRRRG